jgi:hypothetical protein
MEPDDAPPLMEPDEEPLVPLPFIISGCFFIHAMHCLFFCMALFDMPWHFFIIAVSLLDIFEPDDMELLAAKAVLAAAVNRAAVNVVMVLVMGILRRWAVLR